MKTTPLALVLAPVLAAALPLAAQTAAVHHTPVHHTVATHEAACAKLPELSPKIPALPPGTPCARPLYTITKTPEVKLDYVSPLVSPEARAALGGTPTTFSLDYIDTQVGTGPLALPGMYYTVNYTGYLTDGSKFDSSLDRHEPITFPYGQHRVIEGWDTGFEGMHVGGKRRIFIPYELAYGEAGRPPVIPAKSMLIFDMELISQSPTPPAPKAPPTPIHPPEPHPAAKPAEPAKPAEATKPAAAASSTTPKQ